jgi:hypothetical protein
MANTFRAVPLGITIPQAKKLLMGHRVAIHHSKIGSGLHAHLGLKNLRKLMSHVKRGMGFHLRFTKAEHRKNIRGGSVWGALWQAVKPVAMNLAHKGINWLAGKAAAKIKENKDSSQRKILGTLLRGAHGASHYGIDHLSKPKKKEGSGMRRRRRGTGIIPPGYRY